MAVNSRQRLLEAALQYVADNGLTDLTLRKLGEALGTSHRMLIHHFGSKEGLWVEIVKTVEARQREVLATIVPDADKPSREALWTWWKHISDAALWPNERLFFELYGQALRGRPYSETFLSGIVEDWVEPTAAVSIAAGVPPDLSRAHARLGVAVVRGLLLDLLATRDIAAVDAAMAAFLDLYETQLQTEQRPA